MSLTVDIQKNFGTFRLSAAFESDAGTVGILGASGAGKSLTLRCIAGIERPDSGTIILDGVTLFDSGRGIDLPPQKRQVGYLFQNYALFPNMTVRQNILAGLHREKDRLVRERILKEQIETMALSGLEDRYPAALSGGQQQRTALARILANRPKLLLLDEPLSALDAHLHETLLAELRQLLSRFCGSAIVVTHSSHEAYALADTVAVMDAGHIHAHKPKQALFADPETVAGARVTGCRNIAAAERIDAHTVFVPAWGICLQTERPVSDAHRAVGLHTHSFSESIAENRHPVSVEQRLEAPAEDVIRFRFAAQPADTPALTWRRAKGQPTDCTALGIAPADVLLLREK